MEDNKFKLVKAACENFQHVPYWFAQTAMDITDGGFASIYDSEADGWDGRFNNQIGGELLSSVYDKIGQAEFESGYVRLFDASLLEAFPHELLTHASEAEVAAMADRVAVATLLHVKQVFPGMPEAALNDYRERIARFMSGYMRDELRFLAQNEKSESSSAPGI